MEKAWFMAPMEYSPRVEKALWPQRNIASRFVASMEKAWFHESLYFEGVIIMVKDKKKKKNSIKHTMLIKISFMNYMKWTSKSNATCSFLGI